ncbi:MAG: adenosine deaminase [Actinomycetota bacterium]|jgi:adenosine deaminase|nr:adenosine deaminase [Actinomycetota bacterium]
MEEFIRGLPKVELHLHVEGTLEPEMMFAIAARNGLELPFASVDEVRAAYRFTDLQSFLDIYYQGAAVLRTEQDFAELMLAYLRRVAGENVRHAEIFFDPQTHTARGVPFEVFMAGFERARAEAATLGISSLLIMCFLRHLPEDQALETLDEAEPFLDGITAVGLDSSELGNPPGRFERVFARARAGGLRAVAHAGEEGPPSYITGALDLLGAERIDHGVAAEQDDALVERLVREKVPLTMCPLSNLALRVVEDLREHNLKRLLDRGVRVTVNSDDPAYFGGYVTDNYLAIQQALDLDRADVVTLARNAIDATFLTADGKARLRDELASYAGSAVE